MALMELIILLCCYCAVEGCYEIQLLARICQDILFSAEGSLEGISLPGHYAFQLCDGQMEICMSLTGQGFELRNETI